MVRPSGDKAGSSKSEASNTTGSGASPSVPTRKGWRRIDSLRPTYASPREAPTDQTGWPGMLLQLISQARQPRQASFIDAFLVLWKKT